MDTHQFHLIDGTFTGEAAKKMLLAVINSKINFHNLESFSSEITSSGDRVAHARKRVALLEESARSVIALSNAAARNGTMLKISGVIHIEETDEQMV